MNGPNRNPLTAARHGRSALALAFAALLLASSAQAGPQAAAEAAWGCIKANGKAVAQGAQTGVRVLTFIATKPLCVAQLVTPPPAVPQVAMGITVGVATQQKLTSYDQCSDRIYGVVAHPVLGAVKSALDQAPQVPPPLDHLKDGLADLAADNAVELLASIPGAEVVTGGIDCGCALVDAGLQPDTVVQMVATTKQVAQQCTDVLEALGPVGQGIVAVGGAVSTGWRDTVKNPQHMPYQQYYDRFWAPQVEGLAQKLIQPGSQDWTPTVKPVWDRCVDYFDSHDQYKSTARVTCDDMRDGNGNPQWVGANTLGERALRQMPTAVRSSTVLDARAAANRSVIADTYNRSDLLAKVRRWQAAYPVLSAAHCASPPGIRVQNPVPGIRRRDGPLPAAAIACNDHSVPAATLAQAAQACRELAADLSGQIRLGCPEAAPIETPSIRRQPTAAPVAEPPDSVAPAVRPRPPLRLRPAG